MATNTTKNRSRRNQVYSSQELKSCYSISRAYDPTVLGKGASATVYLGKLPGSDIMVAVKRTEGVSSLDRAAEQFQNEVDIRLQANHTNLVRFIGYCDEPGNMALIYEYAEEGTLNDHLHGKREKLVWKQRFRILVECARGLLYLHKHCDPTIIHRDVKSTNVLLFINSLLGEMVAKVADFDISKNLGSQHSDYENYGRTHISTVVAGTPGYLDPEYFHTGHLRDKSDVYSLGVLMLESITGRRATNLFPWERLSISLPNHITANQQYHPEDLPDGFFDGQYNREAMTMVIKVAKDCVQMPSTGRPSMEEVLRTLESAYEKETADIGAKSKRALVKAWCARKFGWKN